ncbi:MAG: TonB-dependent receptor [Bacteroidetes bacterium]|nr:TonB-dependent receptor [Bacteroidota bacterium]
MYLKRILFVLFIVLLSNSISIAQQTGILKGQVRDAVSKELLPGATFQLLSNLAKGTVTDIDGNYSMVLDTGVHQLVCNYIGYVPDTFSIHIASNAIAEKNIQLKVVGKFLETIVVSSGKFDQKLEEMTISMEVIKPALINNKNTTSVETALEQVPGLTIIDNDPQIRGGSGFTFGVGSRVAIVVDGIPLLSGDAGRPEWSYIPVENIEQIEVIKGASSVLYGSSALSGVINVRSAYPRSKPKTVINYSVGNYSVPPSPAENWYNKSLPAFTNLNFLHSRIVKNNLDVVIGANVNVDQGYIGPPPPAPYMPVDLQNALLITDSIPTFSNQDMLKIRGRMNFNLRYRSKKITGLNFGINGNGMLNKTNMVFAWYNDSLGLYKGYPGAVFLEEQKIFNLDPFIKYNNGRGVSHSLTTRIFHTDNFITNNQSNTGTLYYGEYQLQRNFKDLDFNFTGGVVGSMATSYSQLYASSGTPNNTISNASGYLQVDKKFWNILNMSGGFRYEYFKMNTQQSVVAPIFRAGASLQLFKGTFVRTSYGQGFRYPTITERFISTKAGLFGVFPNPDLKPETSKSFEVGLKQGFKIKGLMGYIDVAGFYQKYENTIEYLFGVWDPAVSLVGFKFLNTGDSRVRGVDMSMVLSTNESNKKFGVTALLGYTYVEPVSLTPDSIYATTKSIQPGQPGQQLSYKNSSMDTTDNILKYRFKHMIKVDIEFKLFTKLGIGFSYRYYSRMQNIDKAFTEIEQLTHDASPYLAEIKAVDYWKTHDGFHIFDARASFQMNEKQKLSLICNNLLNTDYSLRPLKIESPRTIALQYVLTL